MFASLSDNTIESWLKFAAILMAFVAIGKLIDWGLRQKRKDRILETLRAWEDSVKSVPIDAWQFAIAKCGVDAHATLKVGLQRLTSHVERSQVSRQMGGMLLVLIAALGVTGFSAPVPWPLAVMLWPVFVVTTFGLAVIAKSLRAREPILPERVFTNLVRSYGSLIVVSAVSAGWTLVALWIGVSITQYDATIASVEKGGLDLLLDMLGSKREEPLTSVRLRPFALALLNFLADYATIFFTVRLLRFVHRRRAWFGVAAVVDFLLSALLTLLLASSIIALVWSVADSGSREMMVAPRGANSFDHALMWFRSAWSGQLMLHPTEAVLTPLLLTTFIPVALYMSVFVFLAFVAKPALHMGSYLCGLLGEKKNTPFFELAAAIGLVATIIKGFAVLFG